MNRNKVTIGLIGDRDETVTAHRAIPVALQGAAAVEGVDLEVVWLSTERVASDEPLARFDGLWCVPASPYRSMAGALRAIRFARENGLPFLGTCGGFQHAVIEYARTVIGWEDADHAETAPDATRAVIAPLACSLIEATGRLHLARGSRLANAYGSEAATEAYHCRYGLNPEFERALASGPLRATARDEDGDVRGIELDDHPFFVATLFQPERAALLGRTPPVVRAFVVACRKPGDTRP